MTAPWTQACLSTWKSSEPGESMTVSGHHENLEDRLYEIMAEGYREDSVYDYLVLFSGGKDSTYLAHLLKKARGKRVCLFTVENGFEESGFLPHVFETAEAAWS